MKVLRGEGHATHQQRQERQERLVRREHMQWLPGLNRKPGAGSPAGNLCPLTGVMSAHPTLVAEGPPKPLYFLRRFKLQKDHVFTYIISY